MTQLLTNREMELFRVAMQLEKVLDDCNPDCGGGGLTMKMIAERVASRLSFDIDEDDLTEMCETISGS
jgi:hypothetical protein